MTENKTNYARRYSQQGGYEDKNYMLYPYGYSPQPTYLPQSPYNIITLDNNKINILTDSPTPYIGAYATYNGSYVASKYRFPLATAYDLNKDPNTHEIVTNSIYKQFYEEWVYEDDFKDIVSRLKVSGRRVKIVSKGNKITPNASDMQPIIEYLKHSILKRGSLERILREMVVETNINWYEVEKNIYFVKEVLHKYLRKKLDSKN